MDANEISEAIVTLIREGLLQGNEVTVPSLGTFALERQSGQFVVGDNDQYVLRPPQQQVRFTPDV
ncbi:MAG: HU family DNA-binding protein [Bacteroidota bacterium]